MAIVITSVPTSPRAKIDSSRIDLTGLDAVTPSVLVFKDSTGAEVGRSYQFVGSGDGKHTFNSYQWPAAGASNVLLVKVADNSTLQTQAVTVQ
jgi:hypothetical protein